MARDAFVLECEQMTDNMQDTAVVTGDVTPVVTGLDALEEAPKDLKDLKITKDTEACVASKNGLVSKLPKTLKQLTTIISGALPSLI